MADVEGESTVVEGEEQQQEQTQVEQEQQQEQPSDEVVVTIGDEVTPASEEQAAPEWVRELRKASREKDREIRELRAQVSGQPKPNVVGPKPTLEGCEYDSDKYEAEYADWLARKGKADADQKAKDQAEQAAQKSWSEKLEAYSKLKGELKVSDYEDAENAVQGTLSQIQQAVILNGADNPALLVYALGKNPKKAKELASITDSVRFAFAVAKLETQLKVQPRKSAPPPESVVRGAGSIALSSDQTLAKLEEEADKTGDRTKVVAYKKQMRQREQAQ